MPEIIPQFLKEMLVNQYGQETTEKIIKGYVKKVVTIRINTIKTSKQEIIDKLKNAQIEFDEIEYNNNALIIRNKNEEDLRKLDVYENGEIYMQSLSSMLPPIVLEPREKENILDMTAAPGGKTTQMSAMTDNKAYITACEKNKIRAERLKYNLQKQGAKMVNVMQEDARKLSDYFSFDKILLDAPCSGSGTENVLNAKFTEELIERSVKTQEELLKKALKILKPGGEMVYSTCSILKQENEDLLKKFLKKSKIEIMPINLTDEIPMLPTTLKGTVCVCPTEIYEGFFVAKIKKLF